MWGRKRHQQTRQERARRFIQTDGDWIFDLCHQVLNHPASIIAVFQAIFRDCVRYSSSLGDSYQRYQRAWVIQRVCHHLLFCLRAQEAHPEGQISPAQRLKQIRFYLQRLAPEDQLLLLLKSRYHFEDRDVSVGMGIPMGALVIKRQQALTCLEEWVWKKS